MNRPTAVPIDFPVLSHNFYALNFSKALEGRIYAVSM